MNKVIFGDNLAVLKSLPDESISLIYLDPPFNTKKHQKRKMIKAIQSNDGLIGFAGEKYDRVIVGEYGSYEDSFDDYIGFIVPRLKEAHRILNKNGCIYIHLDYREVHYVKIEMDKIFGRGNFINEIIWSYDWGARSKSKWSAKHDTILYYAKNAKDYIFNYDKIPRIPYLSPELVGPEKAAKGKPETDSWWHTVVGTNSKEKQNYVTQKPLGILRRIVEVSSNPGDLCLDFFAGSGSFGAACSEFDRNFIMIDNNPQAIDTMKKRFSNIDVEFEDFSEKQIENANK